VNLLDLEGALQELQGITDPWDLLKRATELAPERTALGTSGQITGTAIIAGAVEHRIPLRVFTIDTLRLFPETIEYLKELEKFFGITIERFTPDPKEVERMVGQHGEYLFFDSKTKQEYCCEIRKVRPNRRALETVDIWVSGLRRDQSEERGRVEKVSIVDVERPDGEKRKIIKIVPLFSWSEEKVRAYLAERGIPIHPLLEKVDGDWFYDSLGCIICTTPRARWEPPRAGRWRWFHDKDQSKECGIHTRS
jgi:phosphoadenylyl-sulfate reductase (thioredoxin)